MSDLIRREDVIKLVNQFVFGIRKEQVHESNKAFIKYIEKMPTAYSVDKVVEELESFAKLAEDRWANGTSKHAYQEHKCWVKAIEIVKQGDVETETETIRDKAVKWNNNSSKRVPYEFIDYVEGKREICVSDDVCEWRLIKGYKFLHKTSCGNTFDMENNFKYCPFCGKKIKVVE